uniref:G_PROTEIN_RECEP_F1_2 domain-containing protein n=1 Tax=Rhabditophanes sp. KR3021 TaxID=114890 RepID=A0AC35TUN4_9BILA
MVYYQTVINVTIFCLSLFTNSLVLTLYSNYKTSGRMEAGNLVMFLQAFTDMLFSATSLVFHSEIITQNDYVSYCFVYLNQFNLEHGLYLFLLFIYLTTVNFNFFMVTLTIWARFLTISEKHRINRKRLFKVLFANVVGCIFITAGVVYYGYEKDADPLILPQFYQRTNTTNEYITPTSTSISFKINSWNYLIALCPNFMYISINMLAIFMYLIKYRNFMKSQIEFMSEKTRQLGNDFLRILILQLLAPTFLLFTPILVYLILVIFKLNALTLATIAFQLNTIVPILNPIFFIVGLTKSLMILSISTVNVITSRPLMASCIVSTIESFGSIPLYFFIQQKFLNVCKCLIVNP